MTKQELLAALRARLSGLPTGELEERLAFYSESIDDRIEDGLSEEEAVAALGTVEEIAAQILAEIPLARIVKEKARPKKRLSAWEITLLAVGSPIWLSLLIAAFAVILSVYLSLWSAVISLWGIFASLAGSALGLIAVGIFAFDSPAILLVIGVGLICVGLSIFMFFGSKAATKDMAILTKKMVLGLKFAFLGKEKKK